MSYVRIPFLSKSEDAEPLKRCIESACSKTGVSQYKGTILMTYFLEEIALQVAMGKIVRIPGFGIFAPWLDERPSSVARWGNNRSKPVFSASRGFREEVRYGAPYSSSVKKKVTRHRRNHGLGSGEARCDARVFKAMKAIRDNITAQINGVQFED